MRYDIWLIVISLTHSPPIHNFRKHTPWILVEFHGESNSATTLVRQCLATTTAATYASPAERDVWAQFVHAHTIARHNCMSHAQHFCWPLICVWARAHFIYAYAALDVHNSRNQETNAAERKRKMGGGGSGGGEGGRRNDGWQLITHETAVAYSKYERFMQFTKVSKFYGRNKFCSRGARGKGRETRMGHLCACVCVRAALWGCV